MVTYVILLLCLLATRPSEQLSTTDDDWSQNIAQASNDFSFRLHKGLAVDGKNVFYSPLSLSAAMGMLYYGARGTTANEMRLVLGYDSVDLTEEEVHKGYKKLLALLNRPAAEYTLTVANAAMVQRDYPILEEYKNGIEENFNATVRNIDFLRQGPRAVSEINNWVRENTRGMIEKLLDELSPLTVAVLLNAVYFKGTWKTKFDAKETIPGYFYNDGIQLAPPTQNKVKMMQVVSTFPYANIASGDCQALKLPYEGENMSMLILLPNKLDGLADLESQLNNELFQEVNDKLEKKEVDVQLPKFKMEFKASLKNDLVKMGMASAFSKYADLTGISARGGIYVSDVIHKAVVEVNEEGSEAAAVTGIIVLLRTSLFSRPVRPIFHANHPFLFFIIDNRNNMILFTGRVNRL